VGLRVWNLVWEYFVGRRRIVVAVLDRVNVVPSLKNADVEGFYYRVFYWFQS
jgi:hypothetical protein